MHFFAFAIKRAHYASLRIEHHLAARFGLTPARFDMLYVVKNGGGRRHQAMIARILGISKVTASRMLRAMERAGLLRREKIRSPYHDQRRNYVRVTRAGRRSLFGVLCRLKRRGLHKRFLASIGTSPPDDRWIRLDEAWSRLMHIARAFGDASSMYYPTWHPDD